MFDSSITSSSKTKLALLSALTLLILPLNWLISSILAATVHELFHILAVLLLGGEICGFKLHPSGAEIHSRNLTPIKFAICSLSGPAGSLLLSYAYPYLPRIALCAAVQGAYNLLPVYPLDGGRFLEALLQPHNKTRLRKIMFTATVCILILMAILYKSPGILLPVFPMATEKYLAKKSEKGYNNATTEMR